MPIIYLSPSTQEKNLYVTGTGSEEDWMNRNRTCLRRCHPARSDEQFSGKPQHHRCQFRIRFRRDACFDDVSCKIWSFAAFCILRRSLHYAFRISAGLSGGQFPDYDSSCRHYHFQFFQCRNQYPQTAGYGNFHQSDFLYDRLLIRSYFKQTSAAVHLHPGCFLSDASFCQTFKSVRTWRRYRPFSWAAGFPYKVPAPYACQPYGRLCCQLCGTAQLRRSDCSSYLQAAFWK